MTSIFFKETSVATNYKAAKIDRISPSMQIKKQTKNNMSQIETIMVTLLKEPQTRNKPIIKQ